MANCPKCHAAMGAMDVRCPACGYDFPDEPRDESRTGLAYSWLADIALIVGGVAAGFGCLGAVLSAVAALMNQRYVEAFVYAPIVFFVCLANLVVFLRVQSIKP
jgi:hypothetical protein